MRDGVPVNCRTRSRPVPGSGWPPIRPPPSRRSRNGSGRRSSATRAVIWRWWPRSQMIRCGTERVDFVTVSSEVLPGTDVRQDTDIRPDLSHGDGDHERFAHYVQKDKIVDSAVTGTPVVALCGKVWVPTRDPKRFPVCPDCQRIYESLPEGGDD